MIMPGPADPPSDEVRHTGHGMTRQGLLHAGRASEATEIASLARSLASEEAASLTGQAINVSGGLIMP